jgi:hypothetical protein
MRRVLVVHLAQRLRMEIGDEGRALHASKPQPGFDITYEGAGHRRGRRVRADRRRRASLPRLTEPDAGRQSGRYCGPNGNSDLA